MPGRLPQTIGQWMWPDLQVIKIIFADGHYQ
jgi:hypothetical protein